MTDNLYNIGSATNRWASLVAGDVNLTGNINVGGTVFNTDWNVSDTTSNSYIKNKPTGLTSTIISTSSPYPPGPMTSNNCTINGQPYSCFASSYQNSGIHGPAYCAFDKIYVTEAFWQCNCSTVVLGNHPTNIGCTNYGGEWLQINFPVSITLLNYMLYGRIYGYNPTYWKLVGCNNWLGADPPAGGWNLIETDSNQCVMADGLAIQRDCDN